jgi:hypothetical protein
MPDVLSQGGDREPSPRPRRLAVIAVLVVVVVVVIFQLRGHQHAAPRPSPSAIAGSPAPAESTAVGPAPPAPGRPAGPSGIVGPTLRWDAGLRLPVTGPRPTWFSPATGRMARIGGLPPDQSGYLFTRIGGGWAIQANSAGQPNCNSCVGLPSPVYFLADRAPSVTRLGTADQVAPAARPGAVWLTTYVPGADTRTAAGTAREISVGGAPLQRQRRLPAGYVIDQATSRGLLLAPVSQQPGATTERLWQSGSAQVSRTFAGVIAVSAQEVAWMPRCAPTCRIHVLNLATGRDALVALRPGSSAASAAFSPDGDFLALQVISGSGGDGGGSAMELEVAAAATGRLTTVPGASASSDALVGFGWPAGTDSLVAELSFTTKVQVASWRPGAARLAVAVIRPGQTSTAMIVG